MIDLKTNLKTTLPALAAILFALYMGVMFAMGQADINALYQAILAVLVATGLYNAEDAKPQPPKIP